MLKDITTRPDLGDRTLGELARLYGVSRGLIGKATSMHKHLAGDVALDVLDGRIPATTGYWLSRLPTHDEQRAVAKSVLSKQSGRKKVERCVVKARGRAKRRKRVVVDGAVLLLPPDFRSEQLPKLLGRIAEAVNAGNHDVQ